MIKTPASLLRDEFMSNPSVSPNLDDKQYIQKLQQLGLKHHPSLFPSFFKLKNGLLYPGMATSNNIGPKEVVVQVPESLILSSIKALKEPLLVDVFSEPFYNEQSSWQDRVLITYLLFLYSKEDQQNIFYQMLQHMSKDIDICCFWDPQQWQLFKDATIKSTAINDLKAFEEEWAGFQSVQQKYAQLQKPCISKENYKWIFIHITSRSFGKYIDYTSFVPYCQFFNHHSSSLSYEVNNILGDPLKKSQQQQDQLSSNESDNSVDYLQEGEFDYHEIEPVSIAWGFKECFNLNKKERKAVDKKVKQILKEIEEQIDWEDFSVLFVGKLIERVKIVENQYLSGRKQFKITLEKLEQIEQMKQKYLTTIKAIYSAIKPKSYKYKKQEQKVEKKQFIRPNPMEYKPKYSWFYFKTDRDNFSANNQVYFCYGRNSNRTLLMRYGFAIQGNKYEHVWLSYDISLPLKYMPDLVKYVQQKGISLRRKFKIKHTSINLQLIIFHRLCSWNLYNIRNIDEIFYVMNYKREIDILEEVIDSLKSEVLTFADDLDLTDDSISYHEYFARVYRKEKVSILNKQIDWLEKLQRILKLIDKNQTLEEATKTLTNTERYVMKTYLQSIVI